MLEMEGWGAVTPPIKSFLKVQWDEVDRLDAAKRPAWGAFWRSGASIYWKAIQMAWQPRSPTKRRLAAFALNALLGLQYTPWDRGFWELDAWRSCWRDALAEKRCPFCNDAPVPQTATMEHILRDCAAMQPHRDCFKEGLARLKSEVERKVKTPLPGLLTVWNKWWGSPWLPRESDPWATGWPQLGVIPAAVRDATKEAGVPGNLVLPLCVAVAQLALFWSQAAYTAYNGLRASYANASGPKIRSLESQIIRAAGDAAVLDKQLAGRRWRLKRKRALTKKGAPKKRPLEPPEKHRRRGRPRLTEKEPSRSPRDGDIRLWLTDSRRPTGAVVPDVPERRAVETDNPAPGTPSRKGTRPHKRALAPSSSMEARKCCRLSDPLDGGWQPARLQQMDLGQAEERGPSGGPSERETSQTMTARIPQEGQGPMDPLTRERRCELLRRRRGVTQGAPEASDRCTCEDNRSRVAQRRRLAAARGKGKARLPEDLYLSPCPFARHRRDIGHGLGA
jgi:hypothetical protein